MASIAGPSSHPFTASKPAEVDGESDFEIIPASRITFRPRPRKNRGNIRTRNAGDDDEVCALASPPAHLKRFSNADRPINLDSDGETGGGDEVEIYSKEERERRRALMLDAGPSPGRSRGKRKADASGDGGGRPHAKRAARSDSLLASPPQRTPEDKAVRSNYHHPKTSVDRPGPSLSQERPDPEALLIQVYDVLPDICPEWALHQIQVHLAASDNAQKVVEQVVGAALEITGGYPKAKTRSETTADETKDKPVPEANESNYREGTYRRKERDGAWYHQKTLEALEVAFPAMPLPFIRSSLITKGGLYAPTYLHLEDQNNMIPKPYAPLKRARVPKGKGKSRPEANPPIGSDGSDGGWAEFMLEKAFLDSFVLRRREEAEVVEAKRLAHELELAEGGIECGCCFGEDVWDNMVQCAEGHLFCKECVIRHAETKLGEQITIINCMHTSGCAVAIPESELRRLLSAKLLDLYYRLKQAKELEDAKIDGFETCPNCPWGVVIENPNERLFRCQNETCKQVSCRKCKKKEHLPKTCEEMEADRRLDKRHAVEDAMSDALIRKCPKCAKPYVKETGCNKIMCTGCHTLSCYICQKTIDSYAHFDQNPNDYKQPRRPGACVLWDKDEARHDNEAIIAARDAAQAIIRAAAAEEGIQLAAEDLHVPMPDIPAAPPPYGAGVPGYPRLLVAQVPPYPLLPAPPLPLQAARLAVPNLHPHNPPPLPEYPHRPRRGPGHEPFNRILPPPLDYGPPWEPLDVNQRDGRNPPPQALHAGQLVGPGVNYAEVADEALYGLLAPPQPMPFHQLNQPGGAAHVGEGGLNGLAPAGIHNQQAVQEGIRQMQRMWGVPGTGG